jgi:hypothetical protein
VSRQIRRNDGCAARIGGLVPPDGQPRETDANAGSLPGKHLGASEIYQRFQGLKSRYSAFFQVPRRAGRGVHAVLWAERQRGGSFATSNAALVGLERNLFAPA